MSDRLDFSLTQLRYFVVAAELGNISAAAEQLHISQSTLSSAILRLERQLDCQLFLRQHARGITPTPTGRRLLADARTMLRHARDLREHSRQLQREVGGQLDVGVFSTLAPFLVPPVLHHTASQYPQLSVNVHEAEIDPLGRMLREGACELGLTYSLGLAEDLTFAPVAELRPYALVAEKHPLARRGRAALSELAREPFVLLNLPYLERYMRDLLLWHGVEAPRVISTRSFETMRGLVAAGIGFTILTQRVATPVTCHGERVATVDIVDEVLPVELGIATVAGSRPSRRAEAFIECCRSVAATRYTASPAAPAASAGR